MNGQVEAWFQAEIARGLFALWGLGLKFRPLGESDVKVRAQSWAEFLWAGRRWSEDTDRFRLRSAFTTLAGAHAEFPAPQDFLDVLWHIPKAGEAQKLLEKGTAAERRSRAKAAFERIRGGLKDLGAKG